MSSAITVDDRRRATLERSFGAPAEQLDLRVKRRTIRGIWGTYADRDEGELLALLGSSGHLEVAVNGGSAALMLGCEKGDTVTLIINGEQVNRATGCDLDGGRICLTSEGSEIHFRNVVVAAADRK